MMRYPWTLNGSPFRSQRHRLGCAAERPEPAPDRGFPDHSRRPRPSIGLRAQPLHADRAMIRAQPPGDSAGGWVAVSNAQPPRFSALSRDLHDVDPKAPGAELPMDARVIDVSSRGQRYRPLGEPPDGVGDVTSQGANELILAALCPVEEGLVDGSAVDLPAEVP